MTGLKDCHFERQILKKVHSPFKKVTRWPCGRLYPRASFAWNLAALSSTFPISSARLSALPCLAPLVPSFPSTVLLFYHWLSLKFARVWPDVQMTVFQFSSKSPCAIHRMNSAIPRPPTVSARDDLATRPKLSIEEITVILKHFGPSVEYIFKTLYCQPGSKFLPNFLS